MNDKEEIETQVETATRNMPAFVYLTYPFWGTVMVVALGCFVEGIKLQGLSNLIMMTGVIGLFLSAIPIFKLKNTHVILRIFIACCYYLCSSIVIFILGWMAICWFCPSCH